MDVAAVTLLLLVSIVGGLAAYTCDKPAADLQPCSCIHAVYPDIDVDDTLLCPQLDNERQLLSSLATTLQSYPKMNAFQLQNSSLRFLPADVFKGQKFRIIGIVHSALTALTDSDLAFVGLEHELKYLYLKDVVLQSEWDWSIFRKLSSVETLEVSGLDIDALDKAANDSLLSPNTIRFENNKMRELHPEVFQNFQNTSFFRLGDNQIKSIKRTMFPIPAPELITLDFINNEIEIIPDDMFTQMPVLRAIVLVYNKILTLNENSFKPVLHRIDFIEVFVEDLECDCRLLWIVDIYKRFPFHLIGTCGTPSWLKGRALMSLKSDELYC